MANRALNKMVPKGRLSLEVKSPNGDVLARRDVRNMVLRGGATRVVELLAGMADMRPIDAVGIGFAQDPGGPENTALTPPDAELGIEAEALRTKLETEAFTIDADKDLMVQLSIAATFRPTVELPGVTEAGLLAGDRLYNQVIFEPVTMMPGQNITFFWQIDFPYGR